MGDRWLGRRKEKSVWRKRYVIKAKKVGERGSGDKGLPTGYNC